MSLASWTVRPYVMTGGRTYTKNRLLVHTLVSVPRYDERFAASLAPEVRSVYENARTTKSVAELSAASGMPLGVTRVLIDDLARRNRLEIHADVRDPDVALLERIRDGLRRLR